MKEKIQCLQRSVWHNNTGYFKFFNSYMCNCTRFIFCTVTLPCTCWTNCSGFIRTVHTSCHDLVEGHIIICVIITPHFHSRQWTVSGIWLTGRVEGRWRPAWRSESCWDSSSVPGCRFSSPTWLRWVETRPPIRHQTHSQHDTFPSLWCSTPD